MISIQDHYENNTIRCPKCRQITTWTYKPQLEAMKCGICGYPTSEWIKPVPKITKFIHIVRTKLLSLKGD